MTAASSWLIVERIGTGHRSWFVRLLVGELAERGLSAACTLLVPRAVTTTAEWQRHMGDAVAPGAITEVVDDVTVRKVQHRLGPTTHLVVPDADRWLPGLAWLAMQRGRKLRGCILLLRPEPTSQWKSRAAHWVKDRLVAFLRRRSPALKVLTLRAAHVTGVNEVLDPIEFTPRPVDRTSWLVKRGITPGRGVALVIGDVSERKCVPQLLEAMRHTPPDGPMLALVGKASQTVDSKLHALGEEGRTSNIVRHGGFISDDEFDTWIKNVDLVCVLHTNTGSSGVLLKAWAAGTPVLVGGTSSMVATARQLDSPRLESRGLDEHTLANDLVTGTGMPRERGSTSVWHDRTRAFTASLLELG